MIVVLRTFFNGRKDLKMFLKIFFHVVILLILTSARAESKTDAIRNKISSNDRTYVFVAMHRGDWRNFPENSKGAILSAIRLGADIVELDVQRTKDGRFVLNHDATLNRTTTGKGNVSDFTLEELKKLKLKDQKGRPTEYSLLTLEEALDITRGKILVNIDKFTKYPREILDVVSSVGAMKEVLVKSSSSLDKTKEQFGKYWESVVSGELLYMPIVSFTIKNKDNQIKFLKSFIAEEPRKNSMYEVCFNDPSLVPEVIKMLKEAPNQPRIWVNTLWDSISAKHSDKSALLEPDGNWGWWLEKGATMLQSDYVAELIVYLSGKGLRNL